MAEAESKKRATARSSSTPIPTTDYHSIRSLRVLMKTMPSRSRFRWDRVAAVLLLLTTCAAYAEGKSPLKQSLNGAPVGVEEKAPPSRTERGKDGAPLGVENDAHAAWLRYAPVHDPSILRRYDRVVGFGESEVLRTAETELLRGLQDMLGRSFPQEKPAVFRHKNLTSDGVIVLGTVASLKPQFPAVFKDTELKPDG